MPSIRINYPIGGGPYISADEDYRSPIPTVLTAWGTYSIQKLKDEIAEGTDPEINEWWKKILADNKQTYDPKRGFTEALDKLLKSPTIVCKLWKNGQVLGNPINATFECDETRWYVTFPAIIVGPDTDVYKFTATLANTYTSDNLKVDSLAFPSPRIACPVIIGLTAAPVAKAMLSTATGTSLPLGFRHNYLDPRIESAVAVVYQNLVVHGSVFTIVKEAVKATNFGGVFQALIPVPDDASTTSFPYALRCLLLDARGKVLYVALAINL